MSIMKYCLGVILSLFHLLNVQGIEINIQDRGAIPNASSDNTEIIQRAIDDCEISGGGTVIIPNGIFMSNQLFLKSNVNLCLHKNGVIRALPGLDNWSARSLPRKALVHAVGIENASITGEGSLDGNGCLAKHQTGDNTAGRYYTVFFDNCKRMRVNNVSLINSCFWTFRILDCDNLVINGIRVYSHCNLNNDGIDIDGRNIVISDCIIDCVDDAICLKSDSKTSICENIAISNCVISTNCNGIKFGTASNMGFQNITISNIIIKRPSENNFHEYKIQRLTGVTAETSVNVGLALQMVDGGIMNQINISNIVMSDVLTPFMIKFGNRRNTPKYVRNISISNIIATGKSLMSSSITGFPGNYVENVKISNITFNCPGGGTLIHSLNEIAENEKAYPDNKQFGLAMPAYGLFIRHVKNITLDNIQLNLASPDFRHAFVVNDVENILINNVAAFDHHGPSSFFKMKDVKNVTVSGFSPGIPPEVFLKLEGDISRIKLINNDFTGIRMVIDTTGKFNKSALKQLNNIN